MQKLLLMIILIAGVSGFRSEPAIAASELEVWCLANEEGWDSATSTCTIIKNVTIPVNSAITVALGETIVINEGDDGGDLYNYGTINNDGYIFVDGIIDNFGTIVNGNVIDNEGAIFNNKGAVKNSGVINNGVLIVNHSTIDNEGRINSHKNSEFWIYGPINNKGDLINSGEISIYTHGSINNEGSIDNLGLINNIDGLIHNSGKLYNYCSGIYMGTPPTGNPILSYSSCIYLPCIEQ